MVLNRGKYPLIIFGAAEDLSVWSVSGTPIVTGSQADPVGGTDAYLVNDNDGAAVEYIYDSPVFTIDGTQAVMFMLKEGTAALTEWVLRDTTAATDRAVLRVTWVTHVLSIASGSGQAIALIDIGNGYYLGYATIDNIVAANTHELRLYPAGTVASATGTVTAYLRHTLLLGEHLDQANAFGQPSEDSEWETTPSGVEDAWIVNTFQYLSGSVRWIPRAPQALPRPASPWNGDGELTGVNTGWEYFLNSWARDKQTFLWVPNRSDASINVLSYLHDPMQENPLLETDFTRRIDGFTLKAATIGDKYRGY